MKTYKYVKETWSVRKFWNEYTNIDCDPVHQRQDRQPKMEGVSGPSKAQEIIACMFIGMDIGQITIHRTPGRRFSYESIDGGHRKRYIIAFINNKFKHFESKKYFREFSKEEQSEFMNISLTFCIYETLSNAQVAELFQSLNKTTTVNHQEMLNSFGDIPIANAVRQTVRSISGISSNCHPLFEYTQKNNDSKQKYSLINFDNVGLRIEEMVARVYYRYYAGGGLGVSDKDDLIAMYKDESLDDKKVDVLKKKVKACLDFVHDMAKIRKRKLTNALPQKEFVMYSRLWMYLEHEYGVFNINDGDEFFDSVNMAYSPYKLYYREQPDELQDVSPFDRDKTIGQQFNDALGEFRPAKSVEFPIKCLIDAFDVLSLITVLDPQRCFPREWREAKLIEQNFKCAITGESLTMENAQGAHIIAWSEGGKKAYDNLCMVATHHNRKMGSMSVHQYKDMLAL